MSDPLTEPIVKIHTIFLCAVGWILIYNFYYLAKNYFWFFGISKFNVFAQIDILSKPTKFVCYWLYVLAVIIALILLVVLFWIYCFWMIIIIFVPIVVVFPIPIFPFIFILPLKSLMLLLIPPFKTLTDLGTLPLIYKIASRISDGQIFKNLVKYFLYPTGDDISKYMYFNTNQVIQDVFGYDIADYYKPPPVQEIDDEFKNKTDEYTGKTKEMKDLETNDDPKDIDAYKEYKKDPIINNGMKKIEEETNICVNVGQKFKPYNSSYTDDVKIDADNSFSPYNECYVKAIKSYLKTSIR